MQRVFITSFSDALAADIAHSEANMLNATWTTTLTNPLRYYYARYWGAVPDFDIVLKYGYLTTRYVLATPSRLLGNEWTPEDIQQMKTEIDPLIRATNTGRALYVGAEIGYFVYTWGPLLWCMIKMTRAHYAQQRRELAAWREMLVDEPARRRAA